MKSRLYILIGVPASGKTTWRTEHNPRGDMVEISSDDYIDAVAEDQGLTYSEAFKDNAKDAAFHCNQLAGASIDLKEDVIWDQTNLTRKSREKKLKLFKDYEKIAVVFPIPEKVEWKRRLGSRPGKEIPEEILNNMVASYEPPTKEEGFDEIMIYAGGKV